VVRLASSGRLAPDQEVLYLPGVNGIRAFVGANARNGKDAWRDDLIRGGRPGNQGTSVLQRRMKLRWPPA
jgi:hypothetical protein